MYKSKRFNKVLKLAVILGDLVILNVLFISFNSIWNELFGERACSGTLPQILTLFSVCYFACTISGGVILHRRGARADQIVFRVLRNVFYFSFLSTGLMVLSELEIYSKRFFHLLFHSAHPLYHCLSPAFPFLHTAIQKPWRKFPYGPLFGKHRKYSRAVP